MDFTRKLYLSVLFFFIYLAAISSPLKAENNDAGDFEWSLETKGVYSSGVSDSFAYNRSGALVSYGFDSIEISGLVYRYFNFQVTDGNGVYEYRSFNEAGISMDLYLRDCFNVSGEFSYAADFDDFKKQNLGLYPELILDKLSISGDYSYEKLTYEIDGASVETRKHYISFVADYSINEIFGADIGFSHSNQYFNIIDYNYSTNILRLGMSGFFTDNLALIAGLSIGKDSEDYNIYGLDCGITVLFLSRYKIFALYNYSYYDPPQEETSDRGSGGGTSSDSSTGKNPFLQSSRVGDPYSSHTASLGISVSF